MVMLIVGSIAWVLLLIWLLSMVIPSEEMRREPANTTTYYALWIIMLGLALYLHYEVMASLHHWTLAIITDIIGILSFAGVQYYRYRYYHDGRVADDRIFYNRRDCSWRADLSGICIDPPGEAVNPSDEDR